jgi:Tfp pilus assembly protein PilW
MNGNRSTHLPHPGDEQGFTLIELLVAMLTGIVVLSALLAILEISLRQEASITDRVQADQIGRGALTAVMEELHSSCTGFETKAIQAPGETPTAPLEASGPTNLWFLSSYGGANSGEPTPTPIEHDINWTETGLSSTSPHLKLGKLTDYAFTSTGGEPPNWTFPAPKIANAKARVLATNVAAPTVSEKPLLFQYYFYNYKKTETTYGQLETAAASTPLSSLSTASNYAGNVAKVTVSFIQAPTNADTRSGRTVNFSDSMVLRLSPTSTGEGATNLPCE